MLVAVERARGKKAALAPYTGAVHQVPADAYVHAQKAVTSASSRDLTARFPTCGRNFRPQFLSEIVGKKRGEWCTCSLKYQATVEPCLSNPCRLRWPVICKGWLWPSARTLRSLNELRSLWCIFRAYLGIYRGEERKKQRNLSTPWMCGVWGRAQHRIPQPGTIK